MHFNPRSYQIPFLAAACLIAAANVFPAFAQTAPSGMSVTGYSSTTAMVQDPPGSPWQSVPSASLPAPVAVAKYHQDEWVEIMDQGRPVRISIMNVLLSGLRVPNTVVCPNGTTPAVSAGSQGLGGC